MTDASDLENDADVYHLITDEGRNETCDHDALSRLGGDAGDNQYRQCPDCGSVFVETGDPKEQFGRDTEEPERRREPFTAGNDRERPIGIVVDWIRERFGRDER